MKTQNKILLGLLFLFVVLQFFRPDWNNGERYGPEHISKVYATPPEVDKILERACYTCHSNNTTYPWYAQVQPVGLWLQHHVDEGKAELNFSTAASYTPKKLKHKMEEMVEMIKSGEMPLKSYTWLHNESQLTNAERGLLIAWAKGYIFN